MWRGRQLPLLLARVSLLLLLFSFGDSFLINEPRLLLPFHPTSPISAELRVTHPSGGCFQWHSTRALEIEVIPLAVREEKCSDRALVRATSRVTSNISAVVFATDSASSTTLSCDVSVDHIAAIHITTTTKILYVDALPARMVVTAINAMGASFSTLGSLPFEWEIGSDSGNGDRPVRIVPFHQSSYDVSSEVIDLEKAGKRGHTIILEGLATGRARLTAKLANSHFSEIPADSIDLVVVAKLLLFPSNVIYVPVESEVSFQVKMIRQQSTEVVPMPSPLYWLEVDDEEIGALEKASSTFTAAKKGVAQVTLHSHNVDATAQGVTPPMTLIYVSDPQFLRFDINGQNWLLERGRRYTINVNLLDDKDNNMYISSNARFDTEIPSEYFDIIDNVKNGTVYEVIAKKTGKTSLSSKFASLITKDGIEVAVKRRVRGEQPVEVVDPLQIEPAILTLPYVSRVHSEYEFKTLGGSGAYEYSSKDASVAAVDAASGRVRSGEIGSTSVRVTDRKNPAHYAEATVRVVDVTSIAFGLTRVEAVEGGELWLNVLLLGEKSVQISDCRHLPIQVNIADQRVFVRDTKKKPRLPTEGTGCASFPLKAIASGDTKVKVSFDHYSAEIDVSVYEPVKTSLLDSRLLLVPSGSHKVRVEGGPRPWVVDPSKAYSKLEHSSGLRLPTEALIENIATVACGSQSGVAELVAWIGNEPTTSNPFPARESAAIRVCCAVPTRISITTARNEKTKSFAAIDSVHGCPASARATYMSNPLRLALSAYGQCPSEAGEKGREERLEGISGLSIKWTVGDSRLLSVKPLQVDAGDGRAFALATPHGKAGTVRVEAVVGNNLKASIDLKLVDKATASPSSAVLWNDPSSRSVLRLQGGSGHFVLRSASTDAPFSAEIKDSLITLSPLSLGSSILRVVDVCIRDGIVEVPVRVSDVKRIAVQAPHYVEVGRRVDVLLEAFDEADEAFSDDVTRRMNLTLSASSNVVSIDRIAERRFSLSAQSVGGVSLSANGRSASGVMVSSQPHQIEIFSPILLFPKVVTLVPESTFQVEVVGGPRPTPPLSFALNDSKLASVASNGLIHSGTRLGSTTITGSLNVAEGLSTQDSVVLRVVSLSGVRIVLSTRGVERGGFIWAHLQGFDEDESPFAFGGAEYPLEVNWTLKGEDVFRIASPLSDSLRESSSNRFGVWLEATGSGSATLYVQVKESSQRISGHFSQRGAIYENKVDLFSEEPLGLSSPSIISNALLMAPGGSVPLATNFPASKVSFSVPAEFSSLLSLSPSGVLSAISGREGMGAVEVEKTDSKGRSRVLIPVHVQPVAALDIQAEPPLQASDDAYLVALPLGSSVKLNVVFRDLLGREMHAGPADSALLYRPHRFDLITTKASNANRTLSIRLHSVGETVLKVWDASSPSLSVFLRLSCFDALQPGPLVVGDLFCLRSPLQDGKGEKREWSTKEQALRQLATPSDGIFMAVEPGTAKVAMDGKQQHLYTSVSVSFPSSLSFSDASPEGVSNLPGSRFVFPLQVAPANGSSEWAGPSLHHRGCTSEQLAAVTTELQRPPFHCAVSFDQPGQDYLGPAGGLFHAHAAFDAERGEYACVVSRMEAASEQQHIPLDTPPTSLVVKASWPVHGKVLEASAAASFHVAFEVLNQEISLSNFDPVSDILSLRVLRHLSSDVRVSDCTGNILHINELSSLPANEEFAGRGGNKFFEVKLNVKSAALWTELAEKCALTVESERTGQKVVVPVNIRLLGEAAKQTLHALESSGLAEFAVIFVSRFSHLIPTMMFTCFVFILTLAAFVYIRSNRVVTGVALPGTDSSFLSSGSANATGFSSPSLEFNTTLPPRYSSTPDTNGFRKVQRPGGAPGSPLLFSTADNLRARRF